MKSARDAGHALMPYQSVAVLQTQQGPLAGLTFLVNDLFDLRSYPTSACQPLCLFVLFEINFFESR